MSTELEDNEREARFLAWRNVEKPCTRCDGVGYRSYATTATWHGGIGGNTITWDVCSTCWGTGDADSRGVNLREMTMRLQVLEAVVRVARAVADCFRQSAMHHDEMALIAQLNEALAHPALREK